MKDITGVPKELWYDKEKKHGELTVVDSTGSDVLLSVADWRSVHYLFQYCDKETKNANYVKDVVRPFLTHHKDEQLEQSRVHFKARTRDKRLIIFRCEDNNTLWSWMTTAWKPLTVNDVKDILPQTAWKMEIREPTQKHGGSVTYRWMFDDDVTAVVELDAGWLDGCHAMHIKGTLFSDLGEIVVNSWKGYRHVSTSKIGEGLLDTLHAMDRMHDTLPELTKIPFTQEMLGDIKLTKELKAKLSGQLSVYHVLAILRDAGKKTIAGSVLLNAVKDKQPQTQPTPDPVTVSPQMQILPSKDE